MPASDPERTNTEGGGMGVPKGPEFASGDIYIDYAYLRVMFRWDHAAQKIYVRHHGREESAMPVPHDNGLFTDATLYGQEISRAEYLAGKQFVDC